MNKLLGVALAMAICVGVIPYARSIGTPPVPPGIDASRWVAMGDSAGFVINKDDSPMGSAAAVGVVKGYFMVRRSGAWMRIDSAPGYGIHPAMH